MSYSKKGNKLISIAARIYLFPLIFFGLLFRFFDKIFFKKKKRGPRSGGPFLYD